jgi:hypothetical protein
VKVPTIDRDVTDDGWEIAQRRFTMVLLEMV